jgi:hypothetical protein
MKRKYTTNIINNIDSINPQLWGKSGWIFLFSIALTYEIENKDFYKNFFISIQNILPCNKCRKNYKKHLNDLNDTVFNNKENLLYWLLNIKNEIAIENKQKIITLDEMLNEIYNKNINNTLNNTNINNINNNINNFDNFKIIKNNENNKFINLNKFYVFLIIFILLFFCFFKLFH